MIDAIQTRIRAYVRSEKLSHYAVARLTGLPRATVRDFMAAKVASSTRTLQALELIVPMDWEYKNEQ